MKIAFLRHAHGSAQMRGRGVQCDRTIGALVALLVLVAGGAAPGATRAPTQTPVPTGMPAPPADKLSTFKQEWAKLIAAARKEGALVLMGGAVWARPQEFGLFPAAFEREFGIRVTVGRGSGGPQAQRMLAERRGGVYNVDIVAGGPTTFTTLLAAKALDSMTPLLFHPEVVDPSLWRGGVRRWYGPKEGHVFIYSGRTRPPEIAINTDLVAMGELKSYWDLLDPKWRGKIVAYHPRFALTNSTFSEMYYDADLGPEYFRRMYSEARMVYVTNLREMADGLANGAYAIAWRPSGLPRELVSLQKQGLPVSMLNTPEVVFRSNIVSAGGASMIGAVNNPRNPNAQKLFLNWFLTRDVQKMVNKACINPRMCEYQSLRADVPADGINPLYRLPEGNFSYIYAERDFADKEEVAVNFIRELVKKLGL